MRKSLNKFIIILIVALSIPAMFFSIYEIMSLNSTEKEIEEIYKSQLDAILFSVNQSINDELYYLASQINLLVANPVKHSKKDFNNSIKQLIDKNNFIKMVVLSENNKLSNTSLYAANNDSCSNIIRASIKRILSENENKIKEVLISIPLQKRKIESVEILNCKNLEMVLFALNYTENKNDFCGILIEPEIFIKDVIVPAISHITQNNFIFSILNEKTNKRKFSNAYNTNIFLIRKNELQLVPNYSIEIYLKRVTLAKLVEDRITRIMIVALSLDLILILGIWFLYSNIRREIALEKMQKDFVSKVSHEIKTPLSLITLFAETLTLGRAKSAEKEKEYYSIIHQESKRLGRIVGRILSFYELDYNKKNFRFEAIDLNKVVDELLYIHQYYFQQKEFQVKFEPFNSLPLVNADKDTLIEAVNNIIDNAIKYSHDKKEINIKTGVDDNYVFVKIKDYGNGIPRKYHKKIFEKFYRLKSNDEHSPKGSGLGLAIVKNIMDVHKGKIDLESYEGKGTTFTLKFKRYGNV